jgi:hypothetical protein
MRCVLVLPVFLLAACATAPSMRSPLRERLANSGNSDVEAAARGCLSKEGWKVDTVGSYSGGAMVVSAYKAKDQTDVYIYPPEQHPRITGGPDAGDPFWKCLGGELGGAGDKNADSGDKAGPSGDGDKPGPKGENADKPSPGSSGGSP